MLTTSDEQNGIVKVYWKDIRERVVKIEPKFAKIVDGLNPGKDLPLYVAYYPYGMTIADPNYFYLPSMGKNAFKLTDIDVPQEIISDLGYATRSLPLGMVLEKNIELFIDMRKISLPWLLYNPGTLFPFAKTLARTSNRVYAPNNVLTMVSGARSTFMLPNIGCASNHTFLKSDYNVQALPPKYLHEHWRVFKEIANSNTAKCNWRSCLLFFSEAWLTKLEDPTWLPLKLHLHELAWNFFEYRRNNLYYEMAFSIIQKNRNLKPNPYLADTARHLFATALGAVPGYAPAVDEQSLPLKIIQDAFVNSYRLPKSAPIVMHPTNFSFESDKYPVYYSLQHPATHVFSPKSRKNSSTLLEMRELAHIMDAIITGFSENNFYCSDTVIAEVAKIMKVNYFHNELDSHKIILPSSEIVTLDPRFEYAQYQSIAEGSTFASNAPFVRGCISISNKNNNPVQ